MKVLKNDKLLKISLSLLLMIALILGCMGTKGSNETDKNTKAAINNTSVTYRTHVQNVGWQDWRKDGQLSGTQGRALRLEGININLNDNVGFKIKYQTHIQSVGWQDWKSNGQMSGTEGRELRLEAIRIQLENTEDYSVAYRVHVQNIGWQDWKYDGELAGTEGKSLRLEAIEIKIVKKVRRAMLYIDVPISNIYYNNETINVKGWRMASVQDTKIRVLMDGKDITSEENTKYVKRTDVLKEIKGYGSEKENPTPGFEFKLNTNQLSSGDHTFKLDVITKENEVLQSYTRKFKIDKNIHIEYSAHVQNVGWQNFSKDGAKAGTTGQNKRIEAIKIKEVNFPQGMKLKYKAYLQNIGWQEWKNSNEIAGTTGQNRRLEGIKIKLEGTSEYSVTYRVHVQNIGWQEWCYDEEMAGTIDKGLRVEAIEIKIVPKINKKQSYVYIDTPTNIVLNEAGKIAGWTMTTEKNTKLKILIDNKEISTNELKRKSRQDVLNEIKGYGNEEINNKTPGYELNIDYSKYSLGKHTIVVRSVDEKGNVLATASKTFEIRKKITYYKGTYGVTGLKAKGDNRGRDLEYYRYGDGPNVFFATFAIHGYEDLWAKDGQELVQMANNLYQRLIDSNDYNIANKWTIYIFPGVNLDGLNYGTTNNGPGRTTLFSKAPNNKGIDLNRCWQVGSSYTRYTDNRNYNGTAGFQAYEAQYLRDFLLSHKSANGQTMLVDLHGWTQQLIGDSSICSYYVKQFPENDKSSIGRYGNGYLVNWARNSLGSSSKPAKTALIELPHQGINGHQSVIANGFPTRHLNATMDLLRNIGV